MVAVGVLYEKKWQLQSAAVKLPARPQAAKDAGVPYEQHWDKQSILPATTKIRLR